MGDVQSRAEQRAYTFCVLDRLRKSLQRRDVFVSPSWRYADPRSGLLEGAEWQATRVMICRTLAPPANPEPAIVALSEELDQTYRAVDARLLAIDLPEIILEIAARTGFAAAFTHSRGVHPYQREGLARQ